MNTEQWTQDAYDELFDMYVEEALQRRQTDPSYTIETLESLLETEYIAQGLNWEGRGTLREIKQNATIAAFEHVLAEWRKELATNEIAEA